MQSELNSIHPIPNIHSLPNSIIPRGIENMDLLEQNMQNDILELVKAANNHKGLTLLTLFFFRSNIFLSTETLRSTAQWEEQIWTRLKVLFKTIPISKNEMKNCNARCSGAAHFVIEFNESVLDEYVQKSLSEAFNFFLNILNTTTYE